jgi:glycosyltransferase involved in cell wall biosynthesis
VSHIVINALPTTNPSGRHVLVGHLERLAAWTVGTDRFTVLHHDANADLKRDLGENVTWHQCPGHTRHWLGRSAWESVSLPHLLERLGADLLVNMSGAVVPRVRVRQVTYAMNPWAMIRGAHTTARDRVKAAAQRRGYRKAIQQASGIAFLSGHMRDLYRENAGSKETTSEVVPVGLDADTRLAAARGREAGKPDGRQILTVSVMARHKGIETVVEALALVRRNHDAAARLVLAGPWPDRSYERDVRRAVSRLGLERAVTFKGFVARSELHQLYYESGVFVLMSRCESFGIPGLEAQAFGTPVVGSSGSAMPEVCGDGGFFFDADDVAGTAQAVGRLLTDRALWTEAARRATVNAARYDWDRCSRLLLRLLEVSLGRPLQADPA